MNFIINFGTLSPKVSEQLVAQGICVPNAWHFDLDSDSINRLRIRGLITDSQAHAANKRLMKQIQKVAKQKENTNGPT